MFGERWRIDNYIIEIYERELIEVFFQDEDHQTLERNGRITQSKKHSVELVVASIFGEGGLVSMWWVDWNLSIPYK